LQIDTVTGGKKTLSVAISNIGNVSAIDVPWSISVQGGLLGRINISLDGSVASLATGNTTTIQPELSIFGLGKVTVLVSVKYAEPWSGTGFVLGPFLLRVIRQC
jgi:hypothetical protein